MKSASDFEIPTTANYVQQGSGSPVVLIHGVAASLHDWDDLTPDLAKNGYASYALDLLGHGDSPKPDSRSYHVANRALVHRQEHLRKHRALVT